MDKESPCTPYVRYIRLNGHFGYVFGLITIRYGNHRGIGRMVPMYDNGIASICNWSICNSSCCCRIINRVYARIYNVL